MSHASTDHGQLQSIWAALVFVVFVDSASSDGSEEDDEEGDVSREFTGAGGG